MRNEIKVELFSNYSCEYDLPNTPKEFIKYWEDKFSMIPEDFIDTAKIDVSTSCSYDCGSLEVEIYYYRPETDKEYETRLKREHQQKEFKENQELCELERLKKKYGI